MTTTMWVLMAVMCLVAIGFAVWPLYRHQHRLSAIIAIAVVGVVALSSGLYYRQGSPQQSSAAAALPDMDQAVAGLAARLAENPDNPEGWKMLGRSYMSMGNYARAVDAFEKAVELESAQDPQALVGLGEALLASTGTPIDGRIASLFENALALDPNNPQALFYGGIGAFNRDDRLLAADRWERLLSLNPPAEIEGVLRQRIAEWRGESPVPAEQPPIDESGPQPVAGVSEGAVVRVTVTLADAAVAALPDQATVFVIARDPAQPVPPIAVTRRQLSELPASVELGDRESMVPGRELSAFSEFEIVARVSVSGQPGAQPGDWFGSVIVKPGENNDVDLSIGQQVQ